MSEPNTSLDSRQVFADTDLCVKCGLCLPHCPTYAKTLDENESPRGRLALIQGWAAGSLEASPKLLAHLDNCLLCRACEAACPANVPYAAIVNGFRAATAGQGKPLLRRWRSAALRSLLQHPKAARTTALARSLADTTGLAALFGYGELAAGLPAACSHPAWFGWHPAEGKEISRVSLFLGCTAELADAETVTAAIRVLNRLGVSVNVPEGQGCCGALALHNGDGDGAARMQKRNLAAFDADHSDAILSFASGCSAELGEYSDAPKSGAFAAKIRDISQFIAELAWPEGATPKPLAATALIHSPCSLINVLRAERHVPALMRRIPQLTVTTLPSAMRCCGAAGSYTLEHPEMAAALREDVLLQIEASAPDYLLTSNVGCALHLRAGLKHRGLAHIPVLHPVVLLARQLLS